MRRAGGVLLAGLLALGLLLTLNRLVEPDWQYAVRLVSYTPYALLPYAAVLVAAGLALLRARTPARLLAAVVSVAGLALHVWWYAPLVTGANPPAAQGAEPLRVMTANLHADAADGIAMVEVVAGEDVDCSCSRRSPPARWPTWIARA